MRLKVTRGQFCVGPMIIEGLGAPVTPQRIARIEDRWLPVARIWCFNSICSLTFLDWAWWREGKEERKSTTGTVVSYNQGTGVMEVAHASGPFRVGPLSIAGVSGSATPVSVSDSPLPPGTKKPR